MGAGERHQQAYVTRRNDISGSPWQGMIKTRVPNPSYVEMPLGEDTRTATQRRRYRWRQESRVFSRDEVRTESQAWAALHEWQGEIEAAARRAGGRESTAEYVRKYIDARAAANDIEPSTVAGYRTSAAHIARRFDGTPLSALTPKAVRKWKEGLTGDGLSPSSVKKAMNLLSVACKQAVMDGDLERNPCEGVRGPKMASTKRYREALTGESLDRLLGALDGREPDQFSTAVRIALMTGMRQGEICALTWRDVDLGSARLNVGSSIGYASGKHYLKPPKNDGSIRSVSMPDELTKLISARRALMMAQLAEAGIKPGQREYEETFAGLYVVGLPDGSWLNPTLLSREWRALSVALVLRNESGARATFHDLRHTYATLAVRNGQDVASVSANLGHAQVSTTLNMYTTPNERGKRAANEAVAQALREHAPARVIPLRSNGTEG